jgi:hypothetical protein
MSNKVEAADGELDVVELRVTWRKIMLLAVTYVLMELLLYKALSLYLLSLDTQPKAYLNWVFYFYFPEKKLIFFYFLIFLTSTWLFCFFVDIYMNLWTKRNHELSEK